MADEYELTIDVDATPDAVWAIVGDPDGVPRWFTKYVSSHTSGDIRTLRNAEGGELVERILERDDGQRRYTYTVVSGPPLRSHEASFAVLPRSGGSTIVWRTQARFLDPAIDAEERLAPAQQRGLERLKAICEGVD